MTELATYINNHYDDVEIEVLCSHPSKNTFTVAAAAQAYTSSGYRTGEVYAQQVKENEEKNKKLAEKIEKLIKKFEDKFENTDNKPIINSPISVINPPQVQSQYNYEYPNFSRFGIKY